MANIMAKVGRESNVVTFDHYCDTYEDLQQIDPKYISLGSTAIVLEGANGGFEVYMAKSDKTWKLLATMGGSASSEEQNSQTDNP